MSEPVRHCLLSCVLGLSCVLLGCSEPARRHPAEGVVMGVDRETGQVLIKHEEIDGLMGAMTMSFDTADPTVLEGVHEGQIVTFVVVAEEGRFRAEDIVVTGRRTGGGQAGFERLPDVGDRAPAFELTDQDGNRVTLASLRGGAVLLDFVYTSCPGPCPILTATHVSLQRRLPPALRERTRFVSISLDPARDTPEALRAYARAHGADLASWSFLTGPSEQVDAVVALWGIGKVRDDDGEIEHVTATFLIGSDGRIARRYLGLEHRAEELEADIGALLGAG